MPAPTSVLILANERAGGSGKDQVAAVAEEIARSAAVEVSMTRDADDLDAALDRVRGRTIAIVGGDGSLHFIVRRLWERDELAHADLALVPLGTGNDFARTVGVPLDEVAAAAALTTYEPRPLDLVIDSGGGVVVNVAHAGVGAEAAERASTLKSTLGPAAYPVGAVAAAVGADGWAARLEVDGAPFEVDGGRLLMVAVCNGRTIGGGTAICEHADPGDGLLDIVLVTATGPGARLGFGNDLRRGRHLERDDVSHVRGKQFAIVSEPIGYNSDGELGDPVDSKTFRIEPAVWSLRAPASEHVLDD